MTENRNACPLDRIEILKLKVIDGVTGRLLRVEEIREVNECAAWDYTDFNPADVDAFLREAFPDANDLDPYAELSLPAPYDELAPYDGYVQFSRTDRPNWIEVRREAIARRRLETLPDADGLDPFTAQQLVLASYEGYRPDWIEVRREALARRPPESLRGADGSDLHFPMPAPYDELAPYDGYVQFSRTDRPDWAAVRRQALVKRGDTKPIWE